MIKKKKLFFMIFSLLFVLPIGAFFISYLFVVWSPPGAALLDWLGGLGEHLAVVFWFVHVCVTSAFMEPIHALVPEYFEHSKLVGVVPYPKAFALGVVFYSLVSLGLAAAFGCFGSKKTNAVTTVGTRHE